MKTWRLLFPIMTMCRLLSVSRCGFYAWLKRKPSKRSIENARLALELKAIHEESKGTYGAERCREDLEEKNIKAGIERIKRIRRENGLRCKQKKKHKATTDSGHNMPVFDNLISRDFSATGPNQKWCADLTYIWTEEGWLYLAAIEDVFNREIVGYETGARMSRDLMIRALKKAYGRKKPSKDLIHHSDQGSQYCSEDYTKLLKTYGMKGSMSRKGDCWDNAMMESFWATLKKELVFHKKYKTRAEAAAEVRQYIEVFYNRIRRHSALKYKSPAAYLNLFYQEKMAA